MYLLILWCIRSSKNLLFMYVNPINCIVYCEFGSVQGEA